MFFGEGRLDLFKAREGVAIAHAFALQCGRRGRETHSAIRGPILQGRENHRAGEHVSGSVCVDRLDWHGRLMQLRVGIKKPRARVAVCHRHLACTKCNQSLGSLFHGRVGE